MHADAVVDPHEVIHLRPIKLRSGWAPVLPVVDVRGKDIALGVDVVSVDRGKMIDVLFEDAVAAWTCVVTFGTAGNRSSAHQLAAFEQVHHLLAQ